MEAIGLAGLIAIIYKLVDFLKYLSARDINAAVTQASVWLSAVAVALLARESDPFANVGILGTTFENLELASVVLFALGLGSASSTVMDFKKAIDQTDSAKTPALLPSADHHTRPDSRPVEVV